MNETDDGLAGAEDDAVLEELLASLRQLEPSLEGRVRNRLTIAETLCRKSMTEQDPRRAWWWSGKVSIPVPIAASLLIFVGLACVWSYGSGREQAARQQQSADHGPANSGTSSTVANRIQAPSVRPEAEYHQTEMYLCGVGRLTIESGYFLQEKYQ